MSNAASKRLNERFKAISGSFFNLGTALVATVAAKLYATPVVDIAVLIWAIGAGALIYAGWSVLALLEPED